MNWQSTRPSLLRRLRDPGADRAWRDFDRTYGDLVLRYCMSRGVDFADAADVRQAVFIKLARTFPRFDYDPTRGRFRDFLGRVTHNQLVDHLRRQKRERRVVVQGDEDRADIAPGESDGWEEQWRDHHVRLALATLERTLEARSLEIFRRLLAGEGAEAIAAQHGVRIDVVYKTKQRVRERMTALIASQVAREDEPPHA